MNCTRLQELAAAYALGALDRTEAADLEALADSDPDIRVEVDAFLAVVAALIRQVTPVDAPAGVRDRVLARIRITPQQHPVENVPTAPVADLSGFRFLRPADGAWTESLHRGVRFQVLASNVRRNYMMLYLELDPGAIYPGHSHSGSEELFVVRGDLVTEGRNMQAGDFLHSDPGTHHHDLVSPGGCQALLLTPLTSALGDAARLILKRTAEKVMDTLGLRSP